MRVFLLAYTCSGMAGLIYQVCWTRVLTLSIGHTTGAASAVVAAFLGGLAVGAAAGGKLAARLAPRRAVLFYAVLELAVAAAAGLLATLLRAFIPLLEWAYNAPAPALYPAVRLLVCLALVFVPAAALGATFPLAVRWLAAESRDRARSGGVLYALNSAGAAAGALLAGFVLIPAIGVTGTTLVGVAASLTAAVCAGTIVLAGDRVPASRARSGAPDPAAIRGAAARRRASAAARPDDAVVGSRGRAIEPRWLVATVLGLSGFAALVHEIAWTRVLTMVLGPTIYAFSAALAAVILGIALGSAAGTAVVGRTRRPAVWLAGVLALAAVAGTCTSALAGGPLPRLVAEQMAAAPDRFGELLLRGGLLTTALVVPMAALLGAAFPLALATIDDPSRAAASEFGTIYAVNTVGSVAGALAAGFLVIPALGLEATLRVVTVCLIAAAAIVLGLATMPRRGRVAGAAICAAAVVAMVISPAWDRELLASGAYIYAPFAPKGANLEALLKAGTLLYYREGAFATVSVKRLTGTTTMAVDGKTDASNRGDMLTQKLVAHLPLLLHEAPGDVAIVGLGSGVTVGAALRHPIARADVLEIAPEVVEASAFFAEENGQALADRRTHLIVGDGRSHLQLSQRAYDVIISEPSNPWIAGVAALFTREFFETARERLKPGGLICQWANAYNISDRDLRSIVATFLAVFPHGTAWLVGADDVLLLASDGPLDARLRAIDEHWRRPGVAADLASVAAAEPFALLSLFVAGPAELATYAQESDPLTDNRMRLEFSGPWELRGRGPGSNGAALRALLPDGGGPAVIREAYRDAGAPQWRRRAEMMAARDAHGNAYDDYVQALRLDQADAAALDGFVQTAVLTRRSREALDQLKAMAGEDEASGSMLVAMSRLLVAAGAAEEALEAARRASTMPGRSGDALEQMASIHADRGDLARLDEVVARMRAAGPDRPATRYYEGVAAFLRGSAREARRFAEAAIALDRTYAAAYDLVGAAYTRLGEPQQARDAFLTSLRFDAHDSTAYANLGVLAMDAGDMPAAADYFAEALWLDEHSTLAREGLARVTK